MSFLPSKSVIEDSFRNFPFFRSLYYLAVSCARNIIEDICTFLFVRSLLPATDEEKIFITELKESFGKLPNYDVLNCTGQELSWNKNMNRLKELVTQHDIREFLQWDVIRANMFSSNTLYVIPELHYLKKHPDWERKWKRVLREDSIGRPTPFIFYPSSSGSLIHHAYHLAEFEKNTHVPLSNYNVVLEFGAGYGSLCRLFFRLNPKPKRYICFDLPSFSLLQRYFLKSIGIPVLEVEDFLNSDNCVICLSDRKELNDLLDRLDEVGGKKLFIACWSISEAEDSIKADVERMTRDFDGNLIGWSQFLNEEDNLKFFEKWKTERTDLVWREWEIPQLASGNQYLMGVREK